MVARPASENEFAPHLSVRYTITPNSAVTCSASQLTDAEAEGALREMRRNRDPHTPLLKEWLRHPDERVVIAALRFERYEDGVIPYLRDVVERAAEALQLGYLWTPLLDAVAWRTGTHLEGVLRLALDRLMVWTAREGGVDDLRVMLVNFDSPLFLGAVASRGPHLTADLVWRLLRRDLADRLVCNPYMSREAMEAVINYLVDDRILARWSSKYAKILGLERCVAQLDLLVRSGYRLQPNRIAKLAERLPGLRPIMSDWNCQTIERILRQHLHESLDDMTPRQRRGVAGLLVTGDAESRLSTLMSL